MTRAHSDAQLVEQCAQVQRVDSLNDKAHHGIFCCKTRADDSQSAYLLQQLRAVAEQQLFVGVYLLKADSRDVVDSRSEAVGGDIIGRARLEFERQLVPRCLLPTDGANH